MNQVLEMTHSEAVAVETENFREAVFYPESHEDDMGETTIHYTLISDFVKMLKLFFAERDDVFIAANLNLYYEKNKPRKYHTPDIMVVFGIPNQDRKVYKLWEERQFPQVIFEVASDTTWKKDISDKVEVYEKFGVEEYYLLDPENAYLPLPLMAYRRGENGRLRLEFTEDNRIFSPSLNLEIIWENRKFRLFDSVNQEFLLTIEELKAELDRLKAELKKQN